MATDKQAYLLAQAKVKSSASYNGGWHHWSSSSMRGWRAQMEDAFVALSDLRCGTPEEKGLFAVFDGHGGKEVALFCERHFPEQVKALLDEGLSPEEMFVRAFNAMDDMLKLPESEKELQCLRTRSSSFSDSDRSGSRHSRDFSSPVKSYVDRRSRRRDDGQHAAYRVGSTGNAILLTGDSVVCANAGDSKAVLCRAGVPVELSFEHKPSLPEERRRIEEAGAHLVEPAVNDNIYTSEPRINGSLNLSRSFGDFKYKGRPELPRDRQAVICTPGIKSVTLSPEDEFIVLACDGIWEVKSSSEVCEFIRKRLPYLDLEEIVEELLDDCLAQNASSYIGCDNMTCIIVSLSPKIEKRPSSWGMKLGSSASRLASRSNSFKDGLRFDLRSRLVSPMKPLLSSGPGRA
eukprot:CAMPEP_0170630704 /NCGR_PEP_ID=MMETSP0224-20130122/34168_1 /TAXON_ID=285029 /ORGANISM="Togula jolla, Strain CCCM 725" /LENGTH=403 /DNA_ID=CAMNT_0010958831 /DNA_START=69 /DNA_END=1277 /DNA_ORIENTATION=+